MLVVLLYFTLLITCASAITHPIPSFVIFGLSFIFFLYAFFIFKKKSQSVITALIQILCYSVPLSWRNIFGGDFSAFPISWFHLIGLILILRLILIKNTKISSRTLWNLILVGIVMIFTIIPLLLTHPTYRSQGISQFLIVTFHHSLILFAILKGNIINQENVHRIEKSYILAGCLTGIGIITQYSLFQFGVDIGSIDFYLNRQSFRFLFGDVSHASLYLATTTFLALILLLSKGTKPKLFLLTSIVVTLAASAISSARTGLVVFAIFILLLILLSKISFIKKIVSIIFISIALYITFLFIQKVREIDTISNMLFDSSGRTQGYVVAFEKFLEHPFLGYGFSINYISNLIHTEIPHLSFLQYLLHGGFFYTVLIFLILLIATFHAKKKSLHFVWIIWMVLIGTCLIPDIFSTRYITILVVVIFLAQNKKNFIFTNKLD